MARTAGARRGGDEVQEVLARIEALHEETLQRLTNLERFYDAIFCGGVWQGSREAAADRADA